MRFDLLCRCEGCSPDAVALGLHSECLEYATGEDGFCDHCRGFGPVHVSDEIRVADEWDIFGQVTGWKVVACS